MRGLLIALGGFLLGSVAAAAVVLAVPVGKTATTPRAASSARVLAHPVSASATTTMPMMNGQTMMGGSTVTGTTMMGTTMPAMHLMIQHVQRGCHVWSNGQTSGATMHVYLKPGQPLAIMDMDVDAHQMMQFAGPMHLRMGGPMMMNHGMTLRFSKAGTYRLGTHIVPMPGAMDAKTVGPDNKLRLIVTVR